MGYRHFLVLLVFLGLVITYMLRVNLSVAILAMVNNTALANNHTSHGVCSAGQASNETHRVRDGPFEWDAKTRGVILGAFYYGYVVTEFPGGWLSYRFGGKWIFGLGMLWTAVFTLLTPLTVHLDLPLLIALRVLEGLGEGVAFPCVHGIFAQWVPPEERTRMPAFTFAGIGIGTVIAFPFSAALCNTDIGWPLVFYVFGCIGVLWFVVWSIFGSSSPASSRWISSKERTYIQKALAATVKEEAPSWAAVPWLSMARTPAVWALLASHVSFTWGLYTMVTLLPQYFKDVLGMNMSKNGLYSALPYVCFTVVGVVSGPLADLLIGRGLVTVGWARKLMDGMGHTLPGVFLLAATFIGGCDLPAAVALMCLAIGSEGFVGAGSFANNLDLCGRFAGITFGLINTVGSICGVVAPYVAGAVTQYDSSIVGWRIVFGIAAGMYWLSALVFVLFARGDTAAWARVNETVRMDKKYESPQQQSCAL